MAELSSSQKALIRHRQHVYREWHLRQTSMEAHGFLMAVAYEDHAAHRTIRRILRDAKVVLYDSGRLLLNRTVWSHLRDCMRVPPVVFYCNHAMDWSRVYPRTGSYPVEWHKTTVVGDAVNPTEVPVTLVPAEIEVDVTNKDVLQFFGYVGGNVLDLESVPVGNRLHLDNITIRVTQGNIALGRLAASLGVTPYVYSERPGQTNFATVAVDGTVTLNAPDDAAIGSHSVLVQVVDATGATAIAVVNVEVVAS